MAKYLLILYTLHKVVAINTHTKMYKFTKKDGSPSSWYLIPTWIMEE